MLPGRPFASRATLASLEPSSRSVQRPCEPTTGRLCVVGTPSLARRCGTLPPRPDDGKTRKVHVSAWTNIPAWPTLPLQTPLCSRLSIGAHLASPGMHRSSRISPSAARWSGTSIVPPTSPRGQKLKGAARRPAPSFAFAVLLSGLGDRGHRKEAQPPPQIPASLTSQSPPLTPNRYPLQRAWRISLMGSQRLLFVRLKAMPLSRLE